MSDNTIIEQKVAATIKTEEGNTNPLNDKPFSQGYKEMLKTRRDLAVSATRADFFKLYHANQVMIVMAPTGSGKSTQTPGWIFLDDPKAGQGVACTQSRRLAATSVAGRVTAELDVELGKQVGYRVRFDHRAKPGETKVVYLTGGMLLANYQSNTKLDRFRCLIIDEAHERTVNTDILMTNLKKLMTKRDDLKVIIVSATLARPSRPKNSSPKRIASAWSFCL